VRWREALEEPPFVKISFVSIGVSRRGVERMESRTKNRLERRGSRDSVAVRAHIVKRHFILIQSEQFFLHVILCMLMNVFMCL
jgi:hypothetical protein